MKKEHNSEKDDKRRQSPLLGDSQPQEEGDPASAAPAADTPEGDQQAAAAPAGIFAEPASSDTPPRKPGAAKVSPARRQTRRIIRPTQEQKAAILPFAVNAPPPPLQSEREAEALAAAGKAAARQYSTGFILGVALVVITLVGGIFVSVLYNKVRKLEGRITALEHAASSAPLDTPARP